MGLGRRVKSSGGAPGRILIFAPAWVPWCPAESLMLSCVMMCERLSNRGDLLGLSAVKVGDRVLVEIFDGEKFVDIVGVSKGRGFQGVVKRHHFAGGPKSHGSMFQITGSIGSSAFPSRVFKGMRMSGHMGNARVTTRNLRVLGVDKDENLLVVEGSVPGPNGGYLVILKAKKPPRERRGFAGSATVDPLKAAKRAAKKG